MATSVINVSVPLLLVSLFTCVQPWILTITHKNIIPRLTRDVTLRCFDNQIEDNIQRVDRIRIEKLQSDNTWNTFVFKDLNDAINTSTTHHVTGKMGKPEEAFLTITWPVAEQETVGEYRCEILEINTDDDIVVVYGDKTVNITAHTASVDDVLDIILNMKESYMKAQQTLSEIQGDLKVANTNQDTIKRRQGNLTEGVTVLSERYRAENSSLTEKIRGLQETFVEDMRGEVQDRIDMSYFEARNWPKGPVAIPLPQSGCPQNALSTWTAGYILINQNTKYPMNPGVSQNNHLFEPISVGTSTTKTLSLRFCKINSTEGIEWPKGSYCIYSATTTCPTPFTMTYIRLSTSLSSSYYAMSVTTKDEFRYTRSTSFLDFYFCCRSDGDAKTPIFLPTANPFYLFRHKGTCQTVANTYVSEERIDLATTSNFIQGRTTGILPDFGPTGVSVLLCYYEGRN